MPAPRLKRVNSEANRLRNEDRPAHDWYRFVLSYPPHLVRDYLSKFGLEDDACVLDPFCGTGTTLVECKKQGISSVGIEANPMAHFASRVKLAWEVPAHCLRNHAEHVAERTLARLAAEGISDDEKSLFSTHAVRFNGNRMKALRGLPEEAEKLLLTNSISPLPLHKSLVLLEELVSQKDERVHHHELLALARSLVFSISNLHFGPEVGVGPAKKDVQVVGAWLDTVQQTANDLENLRPLRRTSATVHHADARRIPEVLGPNSIDAVITSPPYPNEKDYTRTTRLESVILGFITTKSQLRELKRALVRSNTRGVYKGDDDDRWIAQFPEIVRIAEEIEARRIELGKTSGFERMYHRVAKLYFGGMARHLAELRTILKPGARLAYVVGDQASYLQVLIRTGSILGDIANDLGYKVESIDLFRTRLATATKAQLREEVVVLRWPGKTRSAKTYSTGSS